MTNEWILLHDNTGAVKYSDDVGSYVNVERYGNCLEVTIVNGTEVRTVDIPFRVVNKVMPNKTPVVKLKKAVVAKKK